MNNTLNPFWWWFENFLVPSSQINAQKSPNHWSYIILKHLPMYVDTLCFCNKILSISKNYLLFLNCQCKKNLSLFLAGMYLPTRFHINLRGIQLPNRKYFWQVRYYLIISLIRSHLKIQSNRCHNSKQSLQF